MAYIPIADSEIDAESPITESLMTRLRDNALAFAQLSFTVLNGSGTYTIPDGITKLRVVMVSGGGGGGAALVLSSVPNGGAGGGGGQVREYFYEPNMTESSNGEIVYSCGAGGAGGGAGVQGGSTTFGDLTVSGGFGGGVAQSGYPGCAGGNSGPHSGISDIYFGGGNDGSVYFGGVGGSNYVGPEVGYALATVCGVGGAAGTGTGAGSGGGPMALPFYIADCEDYLGDGGDAGASPSVGGNGGLYGAGGGGGSSATIANGGNGSAGIIFVLPIG